MAIEAGELRDSSVPLDTFGARLAVVRQHMGGWNVKKAAEFCGLDGGSWRNWERGGSCREREAVCRKISNATGISYDWLMLGGPLKAASPCFSPLPPYEGQMEFAYDLPPLLMAV